MAVDRMRCRDDLPHTLTDSIHISDGHRAVKTQVHIIAVRHRDVNDHRAVGIQVMCRLVKNEEETACICSHGRGLIHIEELHLLGFIDPEV